MTKTLLLATLLLMSLGAGAECDKPGQLFRVKLSAEQIAARNRDYLELCNLQGGTLVDGQRVHSDSRYIEPPWEGVVIRGIDWALIEKGQSTVPARALIGFVLDETGHVIAVSLAGPSGNPLVDEAAMQKVGGTIYAGGAQLDGKPVRAYFSSLVYVDLAQMWRNGPR